jgi:hypothetical protein
MGSGIPIPTEYPDFGDTPTTEVTPYPGEQRDAGACLNTDSAVEGCVRSESSRIRWIYLCGDVDNRERVENRAVVRRHSRHVWRIMTREDDTIVEQIKPLCSRCESRQSGLYGSTGATTRQTHHRDGHSTKPPDSTGMLLAPSHTDSEKFLSRYDGYHLEAIESVRNGCETR